eukprot:TRINITY_DN657_c0_g1_i1.p1 TRINITY_DN657_c0_g1~~TRINITY_DN657_c0_g1_i1.p1  ORF type:complete len:365 (+),score=120.02 TRINITY_DN657_c0_g1_i1:59-1096(+)
MESVSISSERKENAKTDVLAATSADYYFDSYGHFGIHEEMLKDQVRTNTYRKAIVNNRQLFEGKVVLDVGCGTGILSMFAAQAGAKLVIGVDCAGIAEQAKQIVQTNGFGETIQIIRGKIEEIELPVEKVDVIISEWMGYFLLYESMLDSVIYARDKWLVEGGVLMPDQANMYAVAIEDSEYKEDKINFWDDVYGFDMSCIKELAITEPLVDVVPAAQVCSSPVQLFTIDLNTVTKEELDFQSKVTIPLIRNDYVHAVTVYFDVVFSRCHKQIGFSTGPRDKYTHWKQVVFYLDQELMACSGDKLDVFMKVNRNEKNPRDLDILIQSQFHGAKAAVDQERLYRLR